jgi:hypothetical protein
MFFNHSHHPSNRIPISTKKSFFAFNVISVKNSIITDAILHADFEKRIQFDTFRPNESFSRNGLIINFYYFKNMNDENREEFERISRQEAARTNSQIDQETKKRKLEHKNYVE